MHAQESSAAAVGADRGAERGGEAAGAGVGIAGQAPQRALAGEADQQRAADCGELAEPADQLEVLLDGLPEPDTRVEADELFADTGGDRECETLPRNALTSETTSS